MAIGRSQHESTRIVTPGLQNGFWLTNLYGRKSLSCIDFFLYKFKQSAVHISVENYFTHRIPFYILDTCTKKTSKRVKTIVIKLETYLKKDEVFHYFLNYHTASENFIFYDVLKIIAWKCILNKLKHLVKFFTNYFLRFLIKITNRRSTH